VATNDPARPTVEVPLSGTGAERAVISVEPTVIDLTLLRGEQVTRPLEISNQGSGVLELSLVVVDAAASFISFDPVNETVPPLDSRVVTVRFDATDLPLGAHTTEIELRSNDPVEPTMRIPVYLTVVGFPEIRIGAVPRVLESTRSYFSSGATTVHDFQLPAPPAGGAEIELTVDGDYGESTETATVFVEGSRRGEVQGQGSDCRADAGKFPLSAAEFAAASDDGLVEISIQNSRDVGTTCPTNDHTVHLRYSERLEHLDFGTAVIDSSNSFFLIIENSGTDQLEIDSITSDSPAFKTLQSQLAVPTGESRSVTVLFEPSATGSVAATLSLASNDPETPLVTIPLSGTGAEPAAIRIDPAAIDETLPAGESVVRSLTISNDGGVPLDYLLSLDSTPENWLSADPASGSVPAGASLQVSLRFDAAELVAGTLLAEVRVTSNDPTSSTIHVPVALHVTGTPTISVDVATLEFGTVLAGSRAELPIVIENRGSATLEVGSILSNADEFTPGQGALSLSPRSSRSMTVTFAPLSAGSFEGTLSISSNDSTSPVIEIPLIGSGAEPPVIGYEPDVLDESLPAGENTTRALTISNTGGSPLEFSVSTNLAFPSSISSSIAFVDEFELLTPSAVPLTCVVADPVGGFLYAQAHQGTAFYRYAVASDTWEELAPAPLHSGNGGGAALLDGRIYTSYAGRSSLGIYDTVGNSWSTIPSPLPSTANIASDGVGYLYLVRSTIGRKLDPRTGAVFALEPSPINFAQWAGLRYLDGMLYAHQGGGAQGFAVFDVAGGSWDALSPSPAAAALGATIDGTTGRYVTYGNAGESDLYRYSFETASWDTRPIPFFALDNGGVAWLQEPVSAVYVVQGRQGTGLARLVSRPRFLGIEPRSGVVPPAESARVDVSLDSAGLPVGSYAARVVLSSNDPAHPLSDVPVTLSVTGAPNLRVLGASGAVDQVDFSRAFVGSTREMWLTIENNGTESLEIGSVTTDTPIFSVSLATTSLAPGASAMLNLGFHPSAAASFAGRLQIVSNDPGSPSLEIPLIGTGVERYSIEPDPGAIDAALPEGGRTTRTLGIANHGDTPVELALIVDPSTATFVTLDPATVTVPPFGSIEVELGLDSTELGIDTHLATVRIESTDPEVFLIGVPVSLSVHGAPNIAVGGDPVALTSSTAFASSGARTQHLLSVITPSGGPGHLELVAEGDFGSPFETATLDVEGDVFGTVGGAGPDCTPVSQRYPIDSRTLRRLAGDGTVEVEVQNSIQVDTICPSNRHAVTLGYYASADRIELGDVSVGASGDRAITIFNVGAEELVVDSIESADPQFLSSVGAARLPPGARESVMISFTPSSTGEMATTLAITSNDEDSPRLIIPITARGTDPPVIEISPMILTSVLTRGERETRRLTISNVGRTPLKFDVGLPDLPFIEVNPTSGRLSPGEALKVNVAFDSAAVEPGRFEATLTVTSNDPADPVVEVTALLDYLGRPDIAIVGETVDLTSVVGYSTHGAGTDHLLAVPISPAGAGRFELVALGDFGLPIETATLSVEGLELGAVGGMTFDCIPASGSFFVDPSDMERIVADGVVHAHVQNHAEVNVSCTDRHTVRLLYDAPVEQIDFGTVFVGSARAQPLLIRNDGHGRLELSLILTDAAEVATSASGLTVLESGTEDLVVVYSPTSAGPLTGTLEIVTNDPNEPRVTLALVGNAIDPPVARVVPPLIRAMAPMRRDSVRRRSLWLKNTGGSELRWNARAVGSPDTGVDAAAPFRYRLRDSDAPDGPVFDWQDISISGDAIPLAGDDQTWGPVPIGFDFPFYGTTFREVNVCTNGWLSFTSAETSFSNPDSLPDDGFSVPGNLVAPFWDDLDLHGSTSIRYSGDETRFVVQYTGIDRHAAGSELTFQVILYPSGEIVFQYLTMSGTLDSATIGIQNGEKDAGLLVAGNEDYVHDHLAVALSPTAQWVTIDPTAGAVAPGEWVRIRVDLDPNGLERGLHRGEIVVHTNDPLQPVISVPVSLRRLGRKAP